MVSTHLAVNPKVIGVLGVDHGDYAKLAAHHTTAFHVPTITYMYNDEELMKSENFPTLVSLVDTKRREGELIARFLDKMNFTYMDISYHRLSALIASYISKQYLHSRGCGRMGRFDSTSMIPNVSEKMYSDGGTSSDVQLILQNSAKATENWLENKTLRKKNRNKIYIMGSSNGRVRYHKRYQNVLQRLNKSDDTIVYILPFLLNTMSELTEKALSKRPQNEQDDYLYAIYRKAQIIKGCQTGSCPKTSWGSHVIASTKIILKALEENVEPRPVTKTLSGKRRRNDTKCSNIKSLRKVIFRTIVNETRVINLELGENVSFKIRFKENMIHNPVKIGVYRSKTDQYHILGKASFESINIENETLLEEISRYQRKCSEDCPPGRYRSYENLTSELTCCWKCKICLQNHFSNVTNQNTCHKCDLDKFSESNSTGCQKVEVRFIERGSDIFIAGVLFLTVGIVAVIFTAILIRRNEARPLVKASEPGYLYILLVSISIGFCGSFMSLQEPSQLTCTMEYMILVIFTTLTTSNLIWKCIKISSIFTAANSFQRPQFEVLFKRVGQLLIVAVSLTLVITLLVIDGLVTGFGWRFYHRTEEHEPTHPICELQDSYPGIVCLLPLLLPLCYFLAILVFALKMRNFPHNFKETTNILVATLIVLLCCVMFLSGYNVSPPDTKALLRSITFYITSLAFLLCLFLPKVILLLKKNLTPEEEKRMITESLHVFSSKVSKSSPRVSIASVLSDRSNDAWYSPAQRSPNKDKNSLSVSAPSRSARVRSGSSPASPRIERSASPDIRSRGASLSVNITL